MKWSSFALLLGIGLLVTGMFVAVVTLFFPPFETRYANYYAYGPPVYYGAAIGVAGLVLIVSWKQMRGEEIGALIVLGGAILSGFTLFETVILNDEFSLRCFEEVGCNVAFARSSMFGAHVLGFLLAIGTFLLGYGLAFSGRREKPREKSRLK